MNEEKMEGKLEKKFNSKRFKDKMIRVQKMRVPQMMDVRSSRTNNSTYKYGKVTKQPKF